MAKKPITTNKFIEKAMIVHKNKYDYSLVNYIHSSLEVKIICPIHSEFDQIPKSHLSGRGCKYCGNNIKSTLNEFIEKSNIIHNNKYDYSLVDYQGNKSKVKIICFIHSEFPQRPNDHLSGIGCPKCANKNVTTEEFIEKSNIIHNNKYDYSLVDYKNTTIWTINIIKNKIKYYAKKN